MSSKSYFRQAIQGIIQSFRVVRTKEIFVGEDTHGNKYFWQKADPKNKVKEVRRVEALDPDLFNTPTVPVEWMTWLQKRRQNPPTAEEIERNRQEIITIQQRAAELEAKSGKSLGGGAVGRLPLSDTERRDFPKYEEYENVPGEGKDPDVRR